LNAPPPPATGDARRPGGDAAGAAGPVAGAASKSTDAFRTIGELSAELGVAAHVLRYWETRFPQLRPLQRAGNRRYYRAADAALARRIHDWLTNQGYTVKGVQALLTREAEGGAAPAPAPAPVPSQATPPAPDAALLAALSAVRDALHEALDADAAADANGHET